MADTLGKIRRLEQFVSVNNESVDPIVDRTLDKLLSREISNAEALKARLRCQLDEFEKSHGMNSDEFAKRFRSGELGDATDLIEWTSTLEMLEQVERQLNALQKA